MSWEPGGYAEKLGNRYEGHWVVRQLLYVLAEQIRSLVIESVGDDERGVDVWVTRKDGIREAQQCKGRNAGRESWSVKDLERCGVLGYARMQLERDPTYQYTFVSALPATRLGDLCQSARDSSDRPEEYYRHQVLGVGHERRKVFNEFCAGMGLDSESEEGRAKAFVLLRRMHFHPFADDGATRDDLRTWAGMLVAGEPDTIIAVLADFAEDHLRKEIYADDPRRHLSGLGFHPKRLDLDARLIPAIEALKCDFIESIRPGLIRGELIPREETDQILNAISSRGVVVLHGQAGLGKSAVLYEVTCKLEEQGVPFLPIRLDRRRPANTPRQFGADLDLPDSPARCLAAAAGGRPAVLILDQLDALRWTSAHSADALDVCKALVREAQVLCGVEKRVSVILSCRTFDLEHDPEIKGWLGGGEQKQVCKIEVKPLSDAVVKGLVGQPYEDLRDRGKEILRSPQYLAIWVELSKSGPVPPFQSAAQLMREFWQDRRRVLQSLGFSGEEVTAALDAVVDYMEKWSRQDAPRRLLAERPKICDDLTSLGIFRAAGQQIAFTHQSLFDFLVAERVLRHIDQGKGSVVSWLGAKESQSLFRRDQLRLVLALLSDEAPQRFLREVQGVLGGNDVRFHVKHLVLESIAQIESPAAPLADYLIELLADEYWKPHVLGSVFWRHEQHVRALVERGIICTWLNSPHQAEVNQALWLLRSVNERCGDVVADLLEPLVDRGGDWPTWILSTLPIGAIGDSPKLWDLRLRLARRGEVDRFVAWDKLVDADPRRAIGLIEAVVSTWEAPTEDEDELPWRRAGGHRRLEQWSREDLPALKRAASAHPADTWDALMPHIDRLTRNVQGPASYRLHDWEYPDPMEDENPITSIARGMTALVCEAGGTLAKEAPEALLASTRALHDSTSVITQRVLLEVYASLPSAHADEAIQWLLADTRRFEIGPGRSEPAYMPTARLIKAASPHCSEGLFRQLEHRIVHYHAPNERRHAEYYLRSSREGYYGAWYGEAQHFLLPALCPVRRSPTTEGLIGVLDRKFAEYPEEEFLRTGRIRGGTVTSPLRADRLLQISDKAWLGIVRNKKIPGGRGLPWRQVGRDRVAECSVGMFAGDLASAAQRQPERFARLALRFPEDIHPDYVAAILRGVTATKPQDVPEDEKATWEPAKHETIETVLEKLQPGDDRDTAYSFCWLVRGRAAEDWSDRAIHRLLEYATSHSDPSLSKLNVGSSEHGFDYEKASIHDLLNNALNCVRGAAGRAIAALLWEHRDWLPRLRPGIESLVRDPHPAVRVAAVEACRAVLGIDKDLAVRWFCIASRDDLRVAACQRAVAVFNRAFQTHHVQITPLVLAMYGSERDEVAEEGAEEVTARWLFHGRFASEVEECRKGRVPHRKGVAKVAAHLLGEEEYTDRCKDLLLPLLSDPEAEVRNEAAKAFCKADVLKRPGMVEFVKTLIASPAFADDPTWLFLALEDYPEPLLPYADVICEAGEVVAGLASDTGARPDLHHDVRRLSPLLLRLYEQAQEQSSKDVSSRCLDTWDVLFEKQVGSVRDLTGAIDK